MEVATKPTASFIEALEAAGVPHIAAPIASKFNFKCPWRIADIAREVQADVIHTHLSTASLWGSYAGWICRTPVVAHMHALNTTIWYRFASRVATVADAVNQHAISSGIRPERAAVVYNAVDVGSPPDASESAGVRESIGVPTDTPLIAVAAHLSFKKGHHVLLQALAKLRSSGRDFHCACMGEGRDRAALEAQATQLGLAEHVHFLGFRDDCRQVVGAADVVALASISGEGLPLCLLEAAALGKPIVASRLSGIPEIVVDGETGYAVEVGDVDALADRLGELMSDAGLRARMGAAALKLADERFSVAAQADAVEALYRDALGVSDLPETKPAAPEAARTPR